MAEQKITKKKAAKKTYPPAKKTVPKPKWITARELGVIMAEYQARMDERYVRIMAEYQAGMDERYVRIDERDAGMNERDALHDAKMKEHYAMMEAIHAKKETDLAAAAAENKEFAEWCKEMEKLQENTTRTIDKMSKKVDELSENIGRVNNRLGRLIELVVAPKIRHDMNAAGGHNFSHVETNKLVRGIVDGRKEDIAEVDVLLRGPDEVMAVELKTRLRENNVQYHVDRLQNLREYEEEAEIKGKRLLGAVGGVVIDEKAKRLAKQSGLYVIEIREEKEAIDIEKPETCRAW